MNFLNFLIDFLRSIFSRNDNTNNNFNNRDTKIDDKPVKEDIATTMLGTNLTKTVSEVKSYKCWVQTIDGKIVGNTHIEMTIAGKTYTRDTGVDGVAELPIRLNKGDYEVHSVFKGVDGFKACEITNYIHVNPDKTNDTGKTDNKTDNKNNNTTNTNTNNKTKTETKKTTVYQPNSKGEYWNPRYLSNGEEKQTTNYYCAEVSIMQAVYELYGKDLSQRQIAEWAGTTTNGTSHSGINSAIKKINNAYKLDMSIEWFNFSNIGWDKLAQYIKNPNIAVIIHGGWAPLGTRSFEAGHYYTMAMLNLSKKYGYEIYSLRGASLQKRSFDYLRASMNYISQPSIAIISKKAVSGSSKPSTSTKDNNGIKAVFVNNSDMDKVNLETLKTKGYNTIFLAHVSLQKRKKETVTSWIQKANKNNMKVYIWYTTYYNGENIVAANTKEADSRIETVIGYGKIKEVSGIILDYCRYNSNTHNDNIMKAITTNIDKVKKSTGKPVGACTMFESVETLKSYYHQDIKNWNCDYILPMAYKYNYGYNDSKMTELGSTFKKNIKGKLVPIFQNYKGDSNIVDIGSKQLQHDICLIKADGHAVFRYGTGAL